LAHCHALSLLPDRFVSRTLTPGHTVLGADRIRVVASLQTSQPTFAPFLATTTSFFTCAALFDDFLAVEEVSETASTVVGLTGCFRV